MTDGAVSSGDWILDEAELEGLFNEKTKAIILNTPNNPLGKVFNRTELTKIADLCKKHNVLCISDEVYEWMVYDGNEHVRICTYLFCKYPVHEKCPHYDQTIIDRYFARHVGTHGNNWIGR